MATEEKNKKAPEAEEALDLSEQRRIRREKLAKLQAEGRDPFLITRFDRTVKSKEVTDRFEALEGSKQKLAGRIMSLRDMGKASFCDIMDQDGRIQIYVRVDELGEEEYERFTQLDIGDIIGVTGTVFKTKRGQISIHADEVLLLSKSLIPLPDKWSGIKDIDMRYRQRYVDLIMNQDVRDTMIKRTKAVSAIRRYFDNLGYLEVETPILQTVKGGASARPFITHHNALNLDMYLRIATELHLKRCIVGGMERVYEIGRIFRNEGMDTKHNPEFTTIEFYESYTNLEGMMERTEGMMKQVAMEVCGTDQLPFGDVVIDFSKPFARITMTEAVKKYSGVDFDQIPDTAAAKKVADEHHIEYEERHEKGDILAMFFDEYAEDKLIQPTFVTEHPIEISPLTKKCPNKPGLTERFELFVCGSEFANAYSELNDPLDQRQRFEDQIRLQALGDDEASDQDEDFLLAVEYGLPPTGGCGIGVDRFVMLLTNSASIRDVLLFPTMKPEGNQKKILRPAAAPVEEAPVDFSKVEIEPLFAEDVDFDSFSKNDFRAVKVLECEAVPKSKKLLKFTLDDGTPEKRTILSGIHAYYEPEELIGRTLIAITNLPPRAMMGIDSCGMLLSATHTEEGEEKLHLLMVDDHIPAGAKLY